MRQQIELVISILKSPTFRILRMIQWPAEHRVVLLATLSRVFLVIACMLPEELVHFTNILPGDRINRIRVNPASLDLSSRKSTNIIRDLICWSDTDIERVDTPGALVDVLRLLALENAVIHHVFEFEWLQVHLFPMLMTRSVQLDKELNGLGCVLYTSLGTPLLLNIYLCLEVAIGGINLDQGVNVVLRALNRVFW